jgi:hypothetical protein
MRSSSSRIRLAVTATGGCHRLDVVAVVVSFRGVGPMGPVWIAAYAVGRVAR